MSQVQVITLGPRYSYSDSASRRYLQESHIKGNVELLTPPNRTEGIIEELVKRLQAGNRDAKAVVPVLNTIEGRVRDTISPNRGLIKYPDVKICGEYWLKIEHCLAGRGSLKDVKKVFSHEQALGQCKAYLEGLRVSTERTRSTSEAAEIASKDPTGQSAAICSEDAATAYGLNILTRDIADKFGEESENWTRFIVLGDTDSKPTGRDKTTITLELKGAERPRTLWRALDIITQNISYIESMVRGSKTEYVFWLDIDEHRERLTSELRRLEALTKWMTVHGSYPRKIP